MLIVACHFVTAALSILFPLTLPYLTLPFLNSPQVRRAGIAYSSSISNYPIQLNTPRKFYILKGSKSTNYKQEQKQNHPAYSGSLSSLYKCRAASNANTLRSETNKACTPRFPAAEECL
ncbi:hypothetical protein F4815DRAFT_129338 [Daldinia loculata]|nr:hypothetical protein F4815DRAFT_129338 [Daldinia loculata]